MESRSYYKLAIETTVTEKGIYRLVNPLSCLSEKGAFTRTSLALQYAKRFGFSILVTFEHLSHV